MDRFLNLGCCDALDIWACTRSGATGRSLGFVRAAPPFECFGVNRYSEPLLALGRRMGVVSTVLDLGRGFCGVMCGLDWGPWSMHDFGVDAL